jgi:hypothetical protein
LYLIQHRLYSSLSAHFFIIIAFPSSLLVFDTATSYRLTRVIVFPSSLLVFDTATSESFL